MNSSVSAISMASDTTPMDLVSFEQVSAPAVSHVSKSQSSSTKPRIVIPSTSIHNSSESSEKTAGVVVTPRSSSSRVPSSSGSSKAAGKEKVGRWSEEEHKVFLEGLEKHGKQWKLIAGMIGTRTVVQVRTHAQKYFQRMERHQQNGGASSDPTPKPAASTKRKMSLPASLPSRVSKKPKGTPSKKSPVPRAASISLAPAASPTHEMSTYPSYISASSLSSDSGWSTFSPSAVTDTHDFFDPFPQGNGLAVGEVTPEEQLYDFKDLGQDPLEWLVDAEPSFLPESSLPLFPDLSSNGGDDGHHHYQAPPPPETFGGEAAVVEDSSYSVSSASSYEIALNNIVDPNVTVQSLFLLPETPDDQE